MGTKSLLGIITSIILLSGFLGVITFEDVEAKKVREIVVVGSKVKDVIKNEKLSECTVNFLDESGSLLSNLTVEDKGGKVKADVPDGAVMAEIQCTLKDGTPTELLSIELDDEDKKQKIRVQSSGSDPRVESFFDVFYEVYTVDSFFDIFTELQNSAAGVDSFFDVFFDVDVNGNRNAPDSFFDIFTELGTTSPTTIDSFFDVFVELDARDEHFQTEILSMDLRGETCEPGKVVTGVTDEGVLICDPDQQGGLGDFQVEIDAKLSEISDLEAQITANEFDLASLQIQLDGLALPERDILQCQQECTALKAKADLDVLRCLADASAAGQDPDIVCASVIDARDNFSCTCSTTSDPDLAAQLESEIDTIQTEIVALNAQLEDCQLELRILQVLQN